MLVMVEATKASDNSEATKARDNSEATEARANSEATEATEGCALPGDPAVPRHAPP
jgi:hypothetical protein